MAMDKNAVVSKDTMLKLVSAGFDELSCGNGVTITKASEWLKEKHHIEVNAAYGGRETLEGIRGLAFGRELWNAKVEELDKPKNERFGYIWECYGSEASAMDAAIYKACQIITNDFSIKA